MGQLGDSQIVTFEVELEALDKPTDRRRWNGGSLASPEAAEALKRAVEAFQASIRADGFAITRTGYGVTAREIAEHPVPGSLPKLPQSAFNLENDRGADPTFESHTSEEAREHNARVDRYERGW